MKINRRIQVYLFHGVWILFAFYKAFASLSKIAMYLWIITILLVAISLTYILLKRNYMEIVDSELIIYRNFFNNQRLEVKEIIKVELEPNPFVSSYILMKDGRKVKFDDFYLDPRQLKQVFGQLRIEVL